jgi:hypothetical protein
MVVLQTMPHPPQLCESDVMSMHPPSQAAVPIEQPESTAAASAASLASTDVSSEASATTPGASGVPMSSGASGTIAPSCWTVASAPVQSVQSLDENADSPLISLHAAADRRSPPAARTRAVLTPLRLHPRGRSRRAETTLRVHSCSLVV